VVMNGVETSTPIRHYQLTYGNGIPLELASIQETGSDGQSTLPGVTLHWSLFQEAYDPSGCTPYAQPYPGTNPTFCWGFPLIDWVDNGYNGKVSYSYQFVQPGGSYQDTWGSPAVQKYVTVPQVTRRTADPGATGASTPVVDTYSYTPSTGSGNSNAIEPE